MVSNTSKMHCRQMMMCANYVKVVQHLLSVHKKKTNTQRNIGKWRAMFFEKKCLRIVCVCVLLEKMQQTYICFAFD